MTIDTSFLGLRSRFVYGETDWETSLPVRAWDRSTPTVGGSRTSAAGVPASYIVRRDHVLRVTLRFYETEWENVHAMIAWGQLAETLLWYPDANVAGTSFEVYLDSPLAGEDIAPSRSSDYPRTMEVTVSLRTVDGSPWGLNYYGL